MNRTEASSARIAFLVFAQGQLQRKLLLRRMKIVTDQHLGDAGGEIAAADQEKQRVDRQDGVQDAGKYDAQDALRGVLHRVVRIGLLQLLFPHDMGEDRAGRRVEDPADRISQNAQNEEDQKLRLRFFKDKHQHGREHDHAAF